MIRRPPRSTLDRSSAASDVYKRQVEDGLLVPVVRFADGKSLSHISAEVKDFAQRAKSKKLQPSDWEGSTFTISNLGMFGIDEFTAIINPVSYTHLRAHETVLDLVCRLLLEKKKKKKNMN